MALKLMKADQDKLDEINTLVVESEMASTNGITNRDAFIHKYTIGKTYLLTNLSYVLYEDDNMIGFFLIVSKNHEYELEYFYIEHSRLGKGYGKVMWDHVNDVCIKNKISIINIVCGKYVTGFYLKMGAEKISEIDSKAYHGVKIDVLQYRVNA